MLITAENPAGSITINDLKLAGALLGFLALEAQGVDVKYTHLATFCDNMTTVVWAYKLRNPKSCIAGYLLLFLGLCMHQALTSSTIPHHIDGVNNIMADIISCEFKLGKHFEVSQSGLVPYFISNFPLTQQESWTKKCVPSAHFSSVIACLRRNLLPIASLLRQTTCVKSTGYFGKRTPPRQ